MLDADTAMNPQRAAQSALTQAPNRGLFLMCLLACLYLALGSERAPLSYPPIAYIAVHCGWHKRMPWGYVQFDLRYVTTLPVPKDARTTLTNLIND